MEYPADVAWDTDEDEDDEDYVPKESTGDVSDEESLNAEDENVEDEEEIEEDAEENDENDEFDEEERVDHHHRKNKAHPSHHSGGDSLMNQLQSQKGSGKAYSIEELVYLMDLVGKYEGNNVSVSHRSWTYSIADKYNKKFPQCFRTVQNLHRTWTKLDRCLVEAIHVLSNKHQIALPNLKSDSALEVLTPPERHAYTEEKKQYIKNVTWCMSKQYESMKSSYCPKHWCDIEVVSAYLNYRANTTSSHSSSQIGDHDYKGVKVRKDTSYN